MDKITFPQVALTLIVGILVICFAFYQTHKENGTWEEKKMEVTAYCACEKCCETWAKIPVSSGKRKTAGGHIIKAGDKFVAADKRYPFHTKMIIDGYNDNKPVEVLDRGGAIKGNRIDLYFDTHDAALQFGRQNITILVEKK